MKVKNLVLISRGSGLMEGLELWYNSKNRKIILVDVSPDHRFESDVKQWNTVSR
jgi:hypothetical protein